MKKPDRFQRALAKIEYPCGGGAVVTREDALDLMRKHQSALLRLVRTQAKANTFTRLARIEYMTPDQAYVLACTEIEKKMKEYM